MNKKNFKEGKGNDMINFKQALDILKKENKASYPKVKELLKEASKQYYETDSLLMSDDDYDYLYKLFRKATGEDIIGSAPSGLKGTISVKHSYKNLVGSLDSAKNLEEISPFLDKYFKIPLKEYHVRLSLKFDGNSVTIERDEEGKVIKALTRGKDGKGKDLTYIFKDDTLGSLDFYDSAYAIKYEAVISYENYEKLCNDTEEDYANPRSLISGILGRDDAYKYKDYITLVPLELRLEEDEGAIKFQNKIKDNFEEEIDEFYPDNWYTKYKKKITVKNRKELEKEISDYYNYVNSIRSELPFMIDGIVVDMLDEDIIKNNFYNPSGFIPYHNFAIKLPYLEAISEVEDIIYTVGNSGRITPNVVFSPVKFNGTVHTKQSIANYKRFKELRLGKGSKIVVSYRNDVLTYITKLNCPENEKIKPLKYIEKCPICGEDISIIGDTLSYCTNDNCPSKVLGKIENFCIKMDIKGIKINTIEKIYNDKVISCIEDLFDLKNRRKLLSESIGPKSAVNIINAIESKEYYDYEILGSLNIPNISIESAKFLCRKFDLAEIFKMEESEMFNNILNIEGFSIIKTNSMVNGIYDNAECIYFLMNRGYKSYKEQFKNSNNSLKIVFTGFRNKDWEIQLEMMGHKVTSSVSSKTNLVVYGDEPGNVKMKKAKELGIQTMYVDEFKDKFGLN